MQGRVLATADARAYQAPEADACCPRVLDSFRAPRGARPTSSSSKAPAAPSEINLRAGDIANMGFARAADVPVVLIGDIDRGGVIASLVGTRAVLDPADAALIRGFIVNRFRGDPALFADGMAADRRPHRLARRSASSRTSTTPAACPPRTRSRSPASRRARRGGRVRIAVPILPHVANFDDLDPLAAEPEVELAPRPARRRAARRRRPRPPARLEVDHRRPRRPARRRLRHRHRRPPPPRRPRPRPLRRLPDARPRDRRPRRRRGPARRGRRPRPARRRDRAHRRQAPRRRRRRAPPTAAPSAATRCTWARPTAPTAPAPSPPSPTAAPTAPARADGRVPGTYVHGLFADDAQRAAWLARLGGAAVRPRLRGRRRGALDALARHLAAHLDLDAPAQPGQVTSADRRQQRRSAARPRSSRAAAPAGCRPPRARAARRAPITASSTSTPP